MVKHTRDASFDQALDIVIFELGLYGAYPGITRVEGVSEAVHAALLQDDYSYKFIAGRQQEECDRC